MKRIGIVLLALALTCLPVVGSAAQVDCDATYCFTPEDFSGEQTLTGICITQLPDPQVGTVFLGTRVLRPGDILTAQQLTQMTFSPLRTQDDGQATVTYLPIYENKVAPAATMTISIRGKQDKAPVSQDLAMETYKNLPNDGQLPVTDPEGQPLTYTLVRPPKRGSVTLHEDGSFTYTPEKNKVGVDSFVYTATDPGGNVSREATVTVQILKPTDARQYTDTLGSDCRFEAEWLRNTGLFVGETVSGQDCFFPDKTVSRGDFLAMVIQLLEIAPEQADYSAIAPDVPLWLKPYVGAALRAGLLDGWQLGQSFEADTPITGGEAAVLLQNALKLPSQTTQVAEDAQAVWAAQELAVLAENGIYLQADAPLTRGQAAQVLYRAGFLSVTAPGMTVLRLS